MGCSGLSLASGVLIGSEDVLHSLAMSMEEKYHGDTGPDHDGHECGIMGNCKKTMPTMNPEVEPNKLLLESVLLSVICGPVTLIGMWMLLKTLKNQQP